MTIYTDTHAVALCVSVCVCAARFTLKTVNINPCKTGCKIAKQADAAAATKVGKVEAEAEAATTAASVANCTTNAKWKCKWGCDW